ncbi:MAG: hypothetical protein RJA72_613 [Pseudomonadota bacterium]
MENQELNDNDVQVISETMQGACKLANTIIKTAFTSGAKPAEIISALGLAYATACQAANMPDDVCTSGIEFFLENLASFQETVNAVN